MYSERFKICHYCFISSFSSLSNCWSLGTLGLSASYGVPCVCAICSAGVPPASLERVLLASVDINGWFLGNYIVSERPPTRTSSLFAGITIYFKSFFYVFMNDLKFGFAAAFFLGFRASKTDSTLVSAAFWFLRQLFAKIFIIHLTCQ